MIIDFHTHVFPESIAPKTIDSLEHKAHIKAHTNGTLEGLRNSMKEDGIDYSVVLPVVTKPSQFDSINQYASTINNTDGILSFGGIHPDNDNIADKLSYIKESGLRGIKLHPDYQGVYIDDERYIEILSQCVQLKMISVLHAGMDIGMPTPIHCPPDRAYIMLKKVLEHCQTDSKIVLAHIGGHLQWQLVEELLVGENVYFDLAYSLRHIERDTLIRIIKNHGSEKILFATDSPWSGQKESADFIKNLPLSNAEIDNILYKNAVRLLEL